LYYRRLDLPEVEDGLDEGDGGVAVAAETLLYSF
jgi:hypothetical protein